MRAIAIILLALCLAPRAAVAQRGGTSRDLAAAAPTTGSASISGTVVDDEERAVPVRRALVTVAGAGLVPSRTAITDDNGRFAIERLPGGRFTITVSRASFVTSTYGAKRPGKPGTPIAVASGQSLSDLTVKIWRGAVIAGVVRTEDGQPAEGLPVRVIAARQTIEPSILTLDNNGVKTNEAGEFRIFGLPPGTYVLSVTPPTLRGMSPTAMSEADMDAALTALRTRAPASQRGRGTPTAPPVAMSRQFTYAPIYFPGTANMSQAAPITLAPGQILENIDLRLQRVATASVSGSVTLSDGRAAPRAQIQIVLTPPDGYQLDGPAGYAPNAPQQAGATSAADGGFRLPALGPGDYTLTVRATPPGVVVDSPSGSPALWSETQLSVGSDDITGLTLRLEAGPALSGRIAFAEGALKPPADLTQWRVSLVTPSSLTSRGPALGARLTAVPPVALRADGTFEIPGIPPGAYLFRMTGSGLGVTGWWVRSMIAGDRDLLDQLIDVRPGGPSMNVVLSMSDRHTELSGTLRTSGGQPAADVFVIAFSPDRSMWGPGARRVRAVRPGVDGHFSIIDLPPGDYLLGAVTDIDADDWQNLALLDQLAAASVKVSIGEGEKRIQDLQLGRQTMPGRNGG